MAPSRAWGLKIVVREQLDSLPVSESQTRRSKGKSQRIFNRVKVLRMEREMSRAELANEIGVNSQYIGSLERGDSSPSLDLALRVCAVFNLPVEAAFSRKPFGPLSAELYRRSDQ